MYLVWAISTYDAYMHGQCIGVIIYIGRLCARSMHWCDRVHDKCIIIINLEGIICNLPYRTHICKVGALLKDRSQRLSLISEERDW